MMTATSVLRDWISITGESKYLKKVQVRDLTPHDPGNRFDFGLSVNSTIGAALSQWVHDTKFLRPVL